MLMWLYWKWVVYFRKSWTIFLCHFQYLVPDPKMSSSKQKEKEKKSQEKYQSVLARLLREEDNKYCIDCDAKGMSVLDRLFCIIWYDSGWHSYTFTIDRDTLSRKRQFSRTLQTMSYGIRKFWCWTFTQHTSLYLTSYVTDMNYITHRRFFVHLSFINQSIDIFLEFWRFCQSSEHRFPPCLHAELPTTCYNHSIVMYKTSVNIRDVFELRRYRVAIVCSVCYDMIFGVYHIWPHS